LPVSRPKTSALQTCAVAKGMEDWRSNFGHGAIEL
jgi:hypothetical protein